MHVPAGGPLDPERSDRSFAAAAEFFPRHYPEEPLAGYVCVSWLLDPQLSEYLPASANIIRFQQKFDVLPRVPTADPYDGDREMMTLGLQLVAPPGPITPADLDRIPQDTSLQRAFVSHLRAGRHWHQRTGLRLTSVTAS